MPGIDQDRAERLIIQGRVQGVGYRWWAVEQAERLWLRGWVRNRRDGSVEILAIGPAARLDRLAELCARGPASALVTSVARFAASDDGSAGFQHIETL